MHKLLIGFLAVLFGFAVSAEEMATEVPAVKASQAVLTSYRRLLPLEGGSNFRDLGGYPAAGGKTGDVLFTTTGASDTDTYSVVLKLKKNYG